jgi:hypothetical protein
MTFLQLRMGWENGDWCLEMQLVAGASLSLQRAAEGVHSMLCCRLNFLHFGLGATGGDEEVVVVVSCQLRISMLHLDSS